MPASDSIPACGEEGVFVTRCLVSKIVGSRSSNIDDSLVDLSWKTFHTSNTEVVERWITKCPGRTDKNKKVRDFCNKHKNRFQKHIATGEGCKRDFLQSLPELVAIGGLNINAGNDDEQGDDDEVFTDRQEEQADAAAPAAQADAAPAHAPEPHLEQGLQDFIEELADFDLNDADMKTITKRIECLPVNGAPIDVPTAIHAVVTVFEPGTQLSTITSYLSKNQQDGEVRAMLAPELNLAQKLLPHKKMVRQNPSIGNTLPLAIQEALNQDETDRDPFHPKPISKGSFSLANRGDIGGMDGPLDPADLGLVPGAPGDKFMLHKVDVSNASGTVPCFVVIFFFLEERTQKVLHSPHFERKLPRHDRTSPPSPDRPNRKRRAGGGLASFSSIFANLFAWTT